MRFLIECKHPEKGGKIGVAPVRELYGVKVDEGATKAILATTSYFSHDANLFFERHRWELEPRDRDGLLEWIDLYQREAMRMPICGQRRFREGRREPSWRAAGSVPARPPRDSGAGGRPLRPRPAGDPG
ncbi:MAG: restriction endonuclease, partial [bacterium]|nr:restriction endonuclease [bacterium]